MTDSASNISERDEIEMLLPWYVTGRLDAGERARVEHWLAKDATLARQIEILEDERFGTVRSNEALGAPRSLSVQSTLSHVVQRRGFAANFFARIGYEVVDFFTAPTARAVRWGAAAALAVMVTEAAVFGLFAARDRTVEYETASGTATSVDDGTYVLAHFADTASAKDLTSTLAEMHVTIADGPRAGGLFRLRIGDKNMTAEARDHQIAALRTHAGLVTMVTPTR